MTALLGRRSSLINDTRRVARSHARRGRHGRKPFLNLTTAGMKSRNLNLPILALLASGLLLPCAFAQTPPPGLAAPVKIDASAPIPKVDDGTFYRLHSQYVRRAQESPIGLLFLGDSITQGWGAAMDVWRERYWKHHPANFGIGGDTTQNVIWRLANGEIDGVNPRVVVLLLGTNNSGSHRAEEIAAADAKVIRIIREKSPQTKVLLLAVFPRGPFRNAAGVVTDAAVHDAENRMAVIRDLNPLLAKLDDGKNVRFLDFGGKFLGTDGKISEELMPGQLHLSPAGYRVWAEAMQPLLDEMMP